MLRPYQVTQFDKSLDDIAARFHVPHFQAIMDQNQALGSPEELSLLLGK